MFSVLRMSGGVELMRMSGLVQGWKDGPFPKITLSDGGVDVSAQLWNKSPSLD